MLSIALKRGASVNLSEFIQSNGYSFQATILDGYYQEFSDSLGNKGWYIGSELSSGKVTFTFGDWRKPGNSFYFISDQNLTPEEQNELKETAKKFQTEKIAKQESAKKICQDLFTRWDRLGSSGNSSYLASKQLPPRIPGTIVKPEAKGHVLVLPLRDEHGTIWNLQSIYDNGDKSFFNFARVDGLFFEIPGKFENDPAVYYICEGFATGYSVHLSTGARVIVAFTLSNLKSIVPKFPDASFLADHDGGTHANMISKGNAHPYNPGIREARKLGAEFSRSVYSPANLDCESNVDFSDHWVQGGKELVLKNLVLLPPLETDPQADTPTPNNSQGTDASTKPIPQYDNDGIFVGDIQTFSTGFHWSEFKKGNVIYHPDYEDLRTYFERKHQYKILGDSRICHVFNGKYYEPLGDVFLENFAQVHFNPAANNHKVFEFLRLILRTNVKPQEFFNVERKINFNNGYLDLDTKTFHTHTKDVGFRYSLPYDYEAEALAPQFKKFLDRVTLSDRGSQQLLLEFMGYALSGDSCWAQKALVLTGGGSNGKSTFMNIMRAVGGDVSHTPMTLSELKSEYKLQLLDGKLFNMAEETPSKSLVDSSVFKNLVGGGTVIVRQIYKAPYQTRMKAKLIFACNDLPKSEDTTHAFYRRFFIVPFRATFAQGQADFDPFIEEKLKVELPGIFNMVLAAFYSLKKRGKFEETESLVAAVDDFKTTSDPLRYWISEELKVHPLGNGHDLVWVSVAELYSEYKIFCDDSLLPSTNKIDFGRKFSRLVEDYDQRVKMGGPEKARKKGLVGVTKNNGAAFPSNKIFTYGEGASKSSQGKDLGFNGAEGPGTALTY